MKVVRAVQLFFQEGTSDKVYNATLVDEGGGKFTLQVEWGRRGSSLSKGTKAVKVPLAKAEAEMARVIREKTGKGYQEISAEVKPAAVAPPVGQGSASKAGKTGRARTGVAAQLLNACEEHQLEKLLSDPKIVAQQKLDGMRVLVHVGEKIVATNRQGQITTLSREVEAACSEAPAGSILDGELVSKGDEGYWLFDLLRHGDEDLRGRPYSERWAELDALAEELPDPIRLVPSAFSPKEKRALFEKLEKARAEGIVFKKADAPYVSGRPASGGAQLKWKFIKSADVVLLENAGNAYLMGVYSGKKLLRIGKVFAGTTNETRKEIDSLLAEGEKPVAEVQYLYATDDDQLFQPVFVGLRDDKDADDCTLAQLVKTSREAV